MDEFKISLFEREHELSFPKYKTLSNIETQKLVDNLTEKYSINTSNLVLALASKQIFYDETNGLEGFELKKILANLGIKSSREIFINFYKFEKIDVLNIDDLDKYFYDIWFPSSDDIDLFDESLDWILSIRHDGCISFVL